MQSIYGILGTETVSKAKMEEKTMPKRSVKTIGLLVDNEFGVLTRITALVRRDGFNIKSLAVTETKNPGVSRLLIAVECVDSAFPKVLSRLGKLGCVKSAAWIEESFDLSARLDALFSGLEALEEKTYE